MAEREPLTVVLAPSWHRFAIWCQMDNDPPINPRGRNVICITNAQDAQRRLRGRRKQDGDRVVNIGFDLVCSKQDWFGVNREVYLFEEW